MSIAAPLNQGVAHIIFWCIEGVQDRLDYGCLRGSERPLWSYRQWQCLSVIVKIREWPRNPDFAAPEDPILISLRACGSFQRNTLYIGIGLATPTHEA
jgi:hypothetical protein